MLRLFLIEEMSKCFTTRSVLKQSINAIIIAHRSLLPGQNKVF